MTIRDSLFVRVLRALKLVDVSPDGELSHSAGADFIPSQPAVSDYDPLSSLSSMSRFPWIYAACTAVSSDLSAVPLKCMKGTGADAQPLPDHPVMQLLSAPSSRVPSMLFFRQVICDLILTGDAFILVAGSSEPEALLRLHPSRMKIMPQADGQPGEYEYSGGGGEGVVYGYEQILHIRTPSWSDDPRSLWGVGAIQSLHHDLMTDMKTQELTAASAATGRPTGIISPSADDDRWSASQLASIRSATEKQMSSGSGLLVMGGSLEYQAVGWSPKDMEFSSVRMMTREAVLGVLDCPPTRIGLPSANFATSREQAKRFAEGLRSKGRLIAAELTRLARMFPDSEDVTVDYDFSEVEALQESRTDRLNRVMTWVTLGVPVADAAAYEGFDDLPTDNLVDTFSMGPEIDEPLDMSDPEAPDVDADTDEEVTEIEVSDEKPVSAQALNGAQIASLLEILAAVAAGALTDEAGVQLILVAFPSIPIEAAQALVAGSGAISDEVTESGDNEALTRILKHHSLAMVTEDGPDTEVDGLEWMTSDLAICKDHESAEARDMYARQFISKIHEPLEKSMALTMRRYFRGQAARTAKRLADNLPERKGFDSVVTRADFGETFLNKVLADSIEQEKLRGVLRPVIAKMIRQAVSQALKQAQQSGVVITPEWIQNQVKSFTYDLTAHVNQYTGEVVESVLEKAIDEGKTIGEMQTELITNHAFSPKRALRIARTSTTQAVNSGTRKTYEEIASKGVELEIYWMASPGARDAHRELGKAGPIAAGEKFVVPSSGGKYAGKKAEHPGGFGVGALDINCRCTISTRIKR
jgi:HK97 family phage portal protein